MPECQKIKKGGLDQYGPAHFGRLILSESEKNVGMKGLKHYICSIYYFSCNDLLYSSILGIISFVARPGP